MKPRISPSSDRRALIARCVALELVLVRKCRWSLRLPVAATSVITEPGPALPPPPPERQPKRTRCFTPKHADGLTFRSRSFYSSSPHSPHYAFFPSWKQLPDAVSQTPNADHLPSCKSFFTLCVDLGLRVTHEHSFLTTGRRRYD